MRKLYYFLALVLCAAVLSAGEIRSFIVLDYAGSKEALLAKKSESQQTIAEIKSKTEKSNAEAQSTEIRKVGKRYILSVGPYERDDALAWAFLSLRKKFPNAMILDKQLSGTPPITSTKPASETKETVKTVYRELVVEKEDSSLWIAIFGLAIIGVLYMFLSSDTLRRLRTEYEEMKVKHKKLEEKQQEVLASIGDSIHAIAKETMDQTHALVEKSKDTHLYHDMVKVAYSENELLDATSDLIRFLRLKSKKVTINNEKFDINNVLSEISGQLQNAFGNDGTELIFDIDTAIPRYMYADSTQMGQIVTNLLEYFMRNSSKKEIVLSVTIDKNLSSDALLKFVIKSDVFIDNEETLFESYYDEKRRKYIGMGLFVAKELTYLMKGKLTVVQGERYQGSVLHIMLPVRIELSERRKYHFPNDFLNYQKALIIDTHVSALAVEKLFKYFRMDVTVSNIWEIKNGNDHFEHYDIVAIAGTMLTPSMSGRIERAKREKDLKVICLESLFAPETQAENTVFDVSLKKPLTQEYVFDILVRLYQKDDPGKIDIALEENSSSQTLLVHRDLFPRSGGITIDSFRHFGGHHVLIVEDNIINQKVILSMLGKSEMKLSVANNGQEAVDFISGEEDAPVDFVLMDINMPVMDGNRATEILKSRQETSMIPVVALSALNSEYEIEKMFAAGVNGYLSKPVYVDTLYSAFDTFLERKDMYTENKDVVNYLEFEASGLDVDLALHRMNRDDILYRELLKEFMDAYRESDQELRAMLIKQDFEKVGMFCLDMKGLTGTIGAKNMYSIVDKIHRRIIQKKYALLSSYMEKYRVELQSLSVVIKRYLEM